jgi:AcrR family transcriptional regulator
MADQPRRRLSAAARRSELLDAASEVFGRHGYHGASLDDIAQTAGVSKALIYEHFASKRELHAELVQAHAGEIFRRLQASADDSATPEQRLRGGIDAFLSFVEEHRDAWRALFRDAADPDVVDAISAVRDQAAAIVAGMMATAGGRVAPKASKQQQALFFEMHSQLLAGAVQVLAHWWTDHPDIPREAVVDRAMEFCWLGLDRVAQGELIVRGRLRR